MSDQDFFFDEDEKPAAKAPVKTGGTAPSKSGTAASAPSATTTGASVTMTVAILIGVIGILVGAIVGLFIGRGLASTTVTPTAVTAPAAGTGAAPQLSPEQLQGDLPAGHPSIGETSTEATTGK